MNEHGGTSLAIPFKPRWTRRTFGKLPATTLFKVFNIYSIFSMETTRRRRYERNFVCVVYTEQRSASADIPLFFTYCYLLLLPFFFPWRLTRADQPIYRCCCCCWKIFVLPDVYHGKKQNKKNKRKLTWKRCGPGSSPTSHKCIEALDNNSASR